MASTYKTPGVYVEEIAKLPASIAQVETAIPAFIGYTEKAEKRGESLNNVPTRISSLLEYEEYFGGAPKVDIDEVTLNSNNAVTNVALDSNYLLYDSLRMFYANGGGDCYIVSVGPYANDGAVELGTNTTGLLGGLNALEKYDEPTLILYPDGVNLANASDLFNLQQQTLKQCNKLQDRFGIFDIPETTAGDLDANVDAFRNGIGINYLKYGAAYTPYLKGGLTKTVGYRDVKDELDNGAAVTLEQLTSDTDILDIISDLNKAVADVDQIDSDIQTFLGSNASIVAGYADKRNTFRDTEAVADFRELFTYAYGVLNLVDDWANAIVQIKGSKLLTDIQNAVANELNTSAEKIIALDKGAENDAQVTPFAKLYGGTVSLFTASEWSAAVRIDSAPPPENEVGANTVPYAGTNALEDMQTAEPLLTAEFVKVVDILDEIVAAAKTYEELYEKNLRDAFGVYRDILDAVERQLTILPPSGAVAGIYAAVDRDRGVWKAPANVSMSSVDGLTYSITNTEQDGLNVDTVAGKSINAIRAFTGKGILVWGARTLAGNDNEWRYIPVRRFFNMVEESVKKATEFVVFEPNDANTWTRVRGMIENYLTGLWRLGALAGAKPDEAFFVNVGLGITMSAQDILEGRMIVEIGMAAVRPAEFIILRFMHKLQES